MTTSVNIPAGIRTVSQNPVAQASQAAGKQSLNQTDFLKLLTAQLKNQDPTQPVNNDQLVGQLAQLSTVDGINKLNTTMSAIGTKLDGGSAASAQANATALIGKSVLVPGSAATRATDGSVSGAVDVPATASDVVVTIADTNDKTLRMLDLGPQPKGLATFHWDGTDANGASVGAGQVRVSAYTLIGAQRTAATTNVVGRVSGVDLTSTAAPSLIVDSPGATALAAVRQIGG